VGRILLVHVKVVVQTNELEMFSFKSNGSLINVLRVSFKTDDPD